MTGVEAAVRAGIRLSARALAYKGLSVLGRWAEAACIASGALWGLSFAFAGFDLVVAARLWGGFWTHFADAAPAARVPVMLVIGASWILATLFVLSTKASNKKRRIQSGEGEAA